MKVLTQKEKDYRKFVFDSLDAGQIVTMVMIEQDKTVDPRFFQGKSDPSKSHERRQKQLKQYWRAH